MTAVQLRGGESTLDGARRVAIDAVDEARDAGGTMHDAGALAADRVLALLAARGDGEHELRSLLREAWEFPERPGPADGDFADETVSREREEWGARWTELNARITAALAAQPNEPATPATDLSTEGMRVDAER